jgi:hypothetical protein
MITIYLIPYGFQNVYKGELQKMAAKLNNKCQDCRYKIEGNCKQCISSEVKFCFFMTLLTYILLIITVLINWTDGGKEMHFFSPLTNFSFLISLYLFTDILILIFCNIFQCGKWSHAPYKGVLVIFWPLIATLIAIGVILYGIIKALIVLISLFISSFIPEQELKWNGWKQWLLEMGLNINGKNTSFIDELQNMPQRIEEMRRRENNIKNQKIQLQIREQALNQKEKTLNKKENALQKRVTMPDDGCLSRKIEV